MLLDISIEFTWEIFAVKKKKELTSTQFQSFPNHKLYAPCARRTPAASVELKPLYSRYIIRIYVLLGPYMYINIILNSTAAAVQLYNTIPQSNRHDGMTAKYRGCCRKWTLRVVDSQWCCSCPSPLIQAPFSIYILLICI